MRPFTAQKYIDAADSCLAFVKRQMNVFENNYTVSWYEHYADDYIDLPVWGKVSNLPEVPLKTFITGDQYYTPDYAGVVSGTCEQTGATVLVQLHTDTWYYICEVVVGDCGPNCPPNVWSSGRWVGSGDAREWVPIEVGTGIKQITCNGVSIWNETPTYNIRLYTLADVEYFVNYAPLWYIGNGEYMFWGVFNTVGLKIAKLYDISVEPNLIKGIGGTMSNAGDGRLPCSYLIPPDDPDYNFDGSNAMNLHGYMLNLRSFSYDVGLALLMFATAYKQKNDTEALEYGREIMQRMEHEQNADGSWNFSYDTFIGQLFEGYVRNGAIGWVLWGMMYFSHVTKDRSHDEMISKGFDWILSCQVLDESDGRYGLITGGYGRYDNDYNYYPDVITWCSTEHNCSCLQAIEFAMQYFAGEHSARYKAAYKLICDGLIRLYDFKNGRWNQGIKGDGRLDGAYALDCTTWAGSMSISYFGRQILSAVANTCTRVFATSGSIVESTDPEHYNQTYRSATVFDGFKPYDNLGGDYEGAPDFVWSEGTFGYILFLMRKGDNTEELYDYMDSMCNLITEVENCTGGVLYATETWAMMPWEFHVWESVVSSCWLYLLVVDPDACFPNATKPLNHFVKMWNKGR